MEKEYVNEQALNIDGEAFEAAMKAYMEDKGQDKLIAFMEALNKALPCAGRFPERYRSGSITEDAEWGTVTAR